MSKTDKKKAIALLTRVTALKERIATDRDKLRQEFGDLEDLLTTLDSGIEDIEDGLSTVRCGIDAISGQI